MEVKIEQTAPKNRCYVCGSDKTIMVCHHCGRTMCEKHGPAKPLWNKFVRSFEFYRLSSEDTFKNDKHIVNGLAVHCDQCTHISPFFILSLGIMLACLATAYLYLQDGLSANLASILLAWALLFIAVAIVFVQGKHVLSQPPPDVPVMGKINRTLIKEKLIGKIIFKQDGSYESDIEQIPDGTIEVEYKFTQRDRDRVNRYRNRLINSKKEDVHFHAGFSILRGNVSFKQLQQSRQLINTQIFRGKISEQEFLHNNGPGKDNKWQKEYSYSLNLWASNLSTLPIQIIPTYAQQDDEWGIQFTVQPDPDYPDQDFFKSFRQVSKFTLFVPSKLADPKTVSPELTYTRHYPINNNNGGKILVTKVEWEGIGSDTRSNLMPSFFIRFENKPDPNMVLKGQIEIEFGKAISPLEDIDFFSPLGNQRIFEDLSFKKIRTSIEIDLSFHLGSLRIQEIYKVQHLISKKDVKPNSELITKLTDKLSRKGIFIKRIEEGQPISDRKDATFINRQWAIIGREYTQLHPIDFHITINGSENMDPFSKHQKGDIKCEIMVHGKAMNRQMKAKIDHLGKQLRLRIQEIIETSSSVLTHQINGLTANTLRPDSTHNEKHSPDPFDQSKDEDRIYEIKTIKIADPLSGKPQTNAGRLTSEDIQDLKKMVEGFHKRKRITDQRFNHLIKGLNSLL